MKRPIVAVVVAVLCVLVPTAAPTSASSDPFHIFTHNTRDNINALRYAALYSHPLTILGQEICEDDRNTFNSELQQNGYQFPAWYIPDKKTDDCKLCSICVDRQGARQVAATVGIIPTGVNLLDAWYIGEFADQDLANDYRRGYACVRRQYGHVWWACAVHLAAKDGNVTFKQATQMANIAYYMDQTSIFSWPLVVRSSAALSNEVPTRRHSTTRAATAAMIDAVCAKNCASGGLFNPLHPR